MSQRSVWGMSRTHLAVSVLMFPLLLGEPALAANRQAHSNREPQEKAARKACLTGDYANGVSILTDLFVEYHDSTYIFNQGRCLEQNSRYKDAIVRFEEFLRIMAATSTSSPACPLAVMPPRGNGVRPGAGASPQPNPAITDVSAEAVALPVTEPLDFQGMFLATSKVVQLHRDVLGGIRPVGRLPLRE